MSFKIIDSHMHAGGNGNSYLGWDMEMDTLLKSMDRLDIECAISAHNLGLKDLYEEQVEMDQLTFEKSNGRIYSYFCYGPLHIQESLDVIRKNHHKPIYKGIKIHPSGAAIDADDDRYRPVWDIARELKLPIIAHTWNISYYHPSQKSAFAGLSPIPVAVIEVRFITIQHSLFRHILGNMLDIARKAFKAPRRERIRRADVASSVISEFGRQGKLKISKPCYLRALRLLQAEIQLGFQIGYECAGVATTSSQQIVKREGGIGFRAEQRLVVVE